MSYISNLKENNEIITYLNIVNSIGISLGKNNVFKKNI